MISDFPTIFYWWFLLFGLGIIFLPLTKLFFKNFFDFGYAFSKIIAILLVSYLVWLVGSLHLLPFALPTLLFIIFCLIIFNLYLARKFKKELFNDFKKVWKVLIFEEVLFMITLIFWSYIRGFQPDIEGLEKFMDFGFVNSLLRSDYFPPADIWMAGKTINYYYFGHLVAAVLTKISGLDSPFTYNLMIATIFALAFTATFSLVSNLVFVTKPKQMKLTIFGGLFSALLLTLGGNLHSLWWFVTNHFGFTGYWYPDATRFIVEKFGALDNTIHEFPIYSFVVSDLHGHVSNIPFVLLALAIIFAFLIAPKTKKALYQYITFLSFILAVMYMTNSWDFPIYFMILGAIILWINYQKYGLKAEAIIKTLLLVVCCLLLVVLFSLPFHLHFSQIAQGIGFVHARSPFRQLLVLWGYQWLVGLTFIVFLLLSKRFRNHKLLLPEVFILILLFIATLLVIIPEFIYVKDIYIASYHRANTMFKLVYQSFLLYALSSGYILTLIWVSLRKKIVKLFLFIPYFAVLFFVIAYPYFAIYSYYGNLKNYQGLYGLSYLKRLNPNDFAAILWLNQNIIKQPVVLEAVGDSYTDFNRVSANTGLPTIQGWLVHEWLWRGGFEEPGQRNIEVTTIYESPDQNLVKALLKKYKVQYIFIGTKEREKYQISEEKFKTLGSLVFQQENTKIYSLLRLDN